MLQKKNCKKCNQEFSPKSNRQTYCSRECKFGKAICQTCRVEFVRGRGTSGKYCSSRCWYNSSDYRIDEYKKCSNPKCKKEKPISEFPFTGGNGKRSSWCKECHSNEYGNGRERKRLIALRNVLSDFPKRFREERIRAVKTQEEIGKILGVTAAQVRLWELGKSLPTPQRTESIFRLWGWEVPEELRRGQDSRIPLGVGECEQCSKQYPIYRIGTRFCSRKCNSEYHTGERNTSWTGGRINSGGGYIKIKMPDHPNADSNGYVLEHVSVMTQRLGRPLEKGEHVHHKNGKRSDNRDENLELWTVDHKDPPGVRVSDKAVDEILSQEEVLSLPEELRYKVEQAIRRVIRDS